MNNLETLETLSTQDTGTGQKEIKHTHARKQAHTHTQTHTPGI
jgi:hypothetical protein